MHSCKPCYVYITASGKIYYFQVINAKSYHNFLKLQLLLCKSNCIHFRRAWTKNYGILIIGYPIQSFKKITLKQCQCIYNGIFSKVTNDKYALSYITFNCQQFFNMLWRIQFGSMHALLYLSTSIQSSICCSLYIVQQSLKQDFAQFTIQILNLNCHYRTPTNQLCCI